MATLRALTAAHSIGVPEGLRELHAKTVRQTAEMKELARLPEERLVLRAEKISGWSVFQHLEHLAKSAEAMAWSIDQALSQPPKDVQRRPSLMGYLPLWLGFIPRGKGKAPEMTLPGNAGLAELRASLERVHQSVSGLEGRLAEIATARGRSPHNILGYFSARQWLQMLEIHQRHHFKIIGDIQGATGKA